MTARASMLALIKTGARRAAHRVQSMTARVNPAPIIILGNQKTGTSAITHLLADYGGLSKTVDIPESWWPTLRNLLDGTLPLANFAQSHRGRFATDVIKEPNLTFLYPQLRDLHPQARFIFVVRDPRDNIRSLLNRVSVPGYLRHLDLTTTAVPDAWKPLFSPEITRILHLDGNNYIELLASRWNRAVDVYLQNRADILLLKYEDFIKDKTGSIASLAADLGVARVNDIAERVNVQYQPRGDRTASWGAFFGSENLSRLERMCYSKMKEFGYPATIL